MSEGSLEAPTRHLIPWQEKDFINESKIDHELRRVFDVCHGCRRCFNLCDSFPRLFDLIDDSESGELDTVDSEDFKPVVDACTLCDMCFMTKCPYVPPHEFDIDFPHLMLRYRAMDFSRGKIGIAHRQITETDRNGRYASMVAGIINWFSDRRRKTLRKLLEYILGVHRNATLPFFTKTPFKANNRSVEIASGTRKAVLYSTCFIRYNNPEIGRLTETILNKNGVETEIVYPSCCGMPQLEQGDIARVAQNARTVSLELINWIDKGYDIIALVPSCALMLKFEWPLILPEDNNVVRLSQATFDSAEYIMNIAKNDGLVEGMQKMDNTVTMHLACHSRAQNMGAKAAEMLRLIPEMDVELIERCSGHGGSWGFMKNNFDTALKIGRPAARKAFEGKGKIVVSECPLAQDHLLQGVEILDENNSKKIERNIQHPIQILAQAYGIK